MPPSTPFDIFIRRYHIVRRICLEKIFLNIILYFQCSHSIFCGASTINYLQYLKYTPFSYVCTLHCMQNGRYLRTQFSLFILFQFIFAFISCLRKLPNPLRMPKKKSSHILNCTHSMLSMFKFTHCSILQLKNVVKYLCLPAL